MPSDSTIDENDNSPLDSSQKTGGQTLQDNAILSNAELGLELSYPKNWSISQGYNTSLSSPQGNVTLSVHQSPATFNDFNFDSVINYILDTSHPIGTFINVEWKNTTTSGNPDVIGNFNFRYDTYNDIGENILKLQTTYVKYSDKIYVFEYWGDKPDYFPKYLDDVNKIIASERPIDTANYSMTSDSDSVLMNDTNMQPSGTTPAADLSNAIISIVPGSSSPNTAISF